MILGNLDNEVVFKKAFTNKIVFKAFVRDILGIEIEVDIIETEKRFEPRIGNIDFKLDIYAESIDKRVVIEIQRIEYDSRFDRFLHYFFMVFAEQQRKHKNYSPEQTVYMIVILTAPYSIDDKNDNVIQDEVLLLNLNPRTIGGIERKMNDHQLVFLNPNYQDAETPPEIRDWLDLIYQSIHKSENPKINLSNEGIKVAVDLIDYDDFTPEQRTETIDENEKRITTARLKEFEVREIGRKMVEMGLTNDIISEATGLSTERINIIRNTDFSKRRKQ